jgi:hypothetical protein
MQEPSEHRKYVVSLVIFISIHPSISYPRQISFNKIQISNLKCYNLLYFIGLTNYYSNIIGYNKIKGVMDVNTSSAKMKSCSLCANLMMSSMFCLERTWPVTQN